ncbi:hypothetical protein RF55_15816 [Lasius niger]|uniref:ISXO2-like transposase domain-containing protein n=1 Tax=Lasius niger TaxID=67767 RepID=A0A0J7K5Q4_LASNI|nr:hypothetical protein RF55_15816 [Lasius niger]
MWANDYSRGRVEDETNISSCIISDWFNFLREVARKQIEDLKYRKIDDQNKETNERYTVEIDETFLFKRRFLNNKGRIPKSVQYWAVGGICRETRQIFELTEKKNKTVLRDIINRNVDSSSNICTDKWSGYNDLEKDGYCSKQYTINYSAKGEGKSRYVKYVNLIILRQGTSSSYQVTTNSIERLWKDLKSYVTCVREYTEKKKEEIDDPDNVFGFAEEYVKQFIYYYNFLRDKKRAGNKQNKPDNGARFKQVLEHIRLQFQSLVSNFEKKLATSVEEVIDSEEIVSDMFAWDMPQAELDETELEQTEFNELVATVHDK